MIDEERWCDLIHALRESAGEVVDTFVEESQVIVAQLDAFVCADDLNEVQRIAHGLRSSAAIFGAQPLMNAAAVLEATAKAGKEDVVHQMDTVCGLLRELANELTQRYAEEQQRFGGNTEA